MHDVCITAGIKTCEIGSDLMNLLISKRVDLVLQAHDHNYQRSKQLRHKTGVCATVPAGSYAASCVVDSGADGIYAKGAGSVFVISGNFGHCCYAVNAADPEAGYFARFDSTSRGFTKYTVGPGHIDAQFVNSVGAFTDSFSIVNNFDSDADGFTNGVESYAGTNPSLACGVDAWPADINNDSYHRHLGYSPSLATTSGSCGSTRTRSPQHRSEPTGPLRRHQRYRENGPVRSAHSCPN